MARTWLIDGTAFNSLYWKSFVHASLKDMGVFLSDLNAELTDDGDVLVRGLHTDEDGNIERLPTTYLAGEEDALYETNRGALVGQTLSPDGFDKFVLETFNLPEAERYSRFDALYLKAVRGDGTALHDSWIMIPDTAKLVYTLHLWERLQKKKLPPEVWGAVLFLSWPHGKVSSMMFRANLGESEVIKMFKSAPPQWVMAPEDLAGFRSLPKEIIAWRGASSAAKYQERGFSWTLDRERAEWFAHANAFSGDALLIEAQIKREAVLQYSTFEHELVVNPQVPRMLKNRTVLDKSTKEERLDSLRQLLREREVAEDAA